MNCPICASEKTHYFATKKAYEFFRCTICKAIFLDSLPSQKKLQSYYAKQFSYSDGLINENVIRERSAIILKKLKQLVPQAKTLCDVGSGYGFFLDCAQKKKYKVFGIEPSSQLARHAEKQYGIPTFIGNLKEYIKKENKQFDIVTCIHVIEHVSNPKVFVQQLLKLLKSGGILYLETPNGDSHLLYTEMENYTFLIPPDHLWILSSDSIKKILPRRAHIIFTNTYSYSEHFMGILKRTLSLSKGKQSQEITSSSSIPRDDRLTKNLTYLLFDRLLAPLFTGMLNLYHKGSILELYIKKK